MPQSLLLPALVGRGGRPGRRRFCRHRRSTARRQRRAATGIAGGQARARGASGSRADAARDGEAAKAEVLVAAKMEALKLREDLDREVQRRREEWERLERRAEERSRAQERKLEEIEAPRARAGQAGGGAQRSGSRRSAPREGEADRLAQEQRVKLERIAGLTAEDARREILQRVEDEARAQAAGARARHQGAGQARRRPRGAADHLAWRSSAWPRSTPPRAPWPRCALPNDEMKGRIIGREGRNIRAFETATGVDVIIDDTPDTVIVSLLRPDPPRGRPPRRSRR